jgi:hypothetical protein
MWESGAELLCAISSDGLHRYARKSSCFLRTFLLFSRNATLEPQLSQQLSVREYDRILFEFPDITLEPRVISEKHIGIRASFGSSIVASERKGERGRVFTRNDPENTDSR